MKRNVYIKKKINLWVKNIFNTYKYGDWSVLNQKFNVCIVICYYFRNICNKLMDFIRYIYFFFWIYSICPLFPINRIATFSDARIHSGNVASLNSIETDDLASLKLLRWLQFKWGDIILLSSFIILYYNTICIL